MRLPMTSAEFDELGVQVHSLRAEPRLTAGVVEALASYKPICRMDAAAALSSNLDASLGIEAKRLALAAMLLAAGIPVMIEGRSLSAPAMVDAVDVLFLDEGRWLPVPLDAPLVLGKPVMVRTKRLEP